MKKFDKKFSKGRVNINQRASESSLHGGSNALRIISIEQIFEKLSKVELHTLLLHPGQFTAYPVLKIFEIENKAT